MNVEEIVDDSPEYDEVKAKVIAQLKELGGDKAALAHFIEAGASEMYKKGLMACMATEIKPMQTMQGWIETIASSTGQLLALSVQDGNDEGAMRILEAITAHFMNATLDSYHSQSEMFRARKSDQKH